MFDVKVTNDQDVSPLRAWWIVESGQRDAHPSGALMYRSIKWGTVVGTWQDDVFEIFRFYK